MDSCSLFELGLPAMKVIDFRLFTLLLNLII